MSFLFFFFFQAEDGIRDHCVTGVQTCALPIYEAALRMAKAGTWLVCADDCGFASVLIARLKSASQDVVTVRAGSGFQQLDPRTFTIEPANSQHYELLIQALQANQSLPDRIVHAWSVTGTPSAQPKGDTF